MKHLISILTIVKNNGSTIERTIRSVLSQTYDNVEFVIVDGVSVDNSLEIINSYKNCIDIIISEPDNGPGEAINKAIRCASGDYIAWLPADDWIPTNYIETAVNIIGDSGYDFIFGDSIWVNDKGNKKIAKGNINYKKQFPYIRSFGFGPMVIKRNLFFDYGFIEESKHVAIDLEWLIRVMTNKKIIYDVYSEKLIMYISYGGISNLTFFNSLKANLWAVKKNNHNVYICFFVYFILFIKYHIGKLITFLFGEKFLLILKEVIYRTKK